MWFLKPKRLPTLSEILVLEKDLILNGHLDQLGNLNVEKERALNELKHGKTKPDRSELKKIQTQAIQNLRLIDAAKTGVQSVRKRLIELNRVVDGADTYGKDGQRKVHDTKAPKKKSSINSCQLLGRRNFDKPETL